MNLTQQEHTCVACRAVGAFAMADGEFICTKCGAVSAEQTNEIDLEFKKAQDRELMASTHAVVDRSKLVPMGEQHDQISPSNRGFTALFHPMNGAKDFENKGIKMFLNYPYEVGQVIGKGAKIVEEPMNFGLLECKHVKRTAKELKPGYWVLCKKCGAHKKVVKVEVRVVPVPHKLSTDDLFYRNCKNEVNAVCERLSLDIFTRDCYGQVFDEDYQSLVNIAEKLLARRALLSMAITHKGLAIKPAKELKEEYLDLVKQVQEALVSPLLEQFEQPEAVLMPTP